MWHTSSLLHDDVIDHAETRRGKVSVNNRWDASRSIFAGDFILGISAKLLAQTGNPDVGTHPIVLDVIALICR